MNKSEGIGAGGGRPKSTNNENTPPASGSHEGKVITLENGASLVSNANNDATQQKSDIDNRNISPKEVVTDKDKASKQWHKRAAHKIHKRGGQAVEKIANFFTSKEAKKTTPTSNNTPPPNDSADFSSPSDTSTSNDASTVTSPPKSELATKMELNKTKIIDLVGADPNTMTKEEIKDLLESTIKFCDFVTIKKEQVEYWKNNETPAPDNNTDYVPEDVRKQVIRHAKVAVALTVRASLNNQLTKLEKTELNLAEKGKKAADNIEKGKNKKATLQPATVEIIPANKCPPNNDALHTVMAQKVEVSTQTEQEVTPETVSVDVNTLRTLAVVDAIDAEQASTNIDTFLKELEPSQATPEQKESFKKKTFLATLLTAIYGKVQKIYSALITLKMKFHISIARDKGQIDLTSYLEKFDENTTTKAKGFTNSLLNEMEKFNSMYDEYHLLNQENKEDADIKAIKSAEMIHQLADIAKIAEDLYKKTNETLKECKKLPGVDLDKLNQADENAHYAMKNLSAIKSSIGYSSQVVSRILALAQKPIDTLAEEIEDAPDDIPVSLMSDNKHIVVA